LGPGDEGQAFFFEKTARKFPEDAPASAVLQQGGWFIVQASERLVVGCEAATLR
jgi:hypothetical protein